MNLQQSAIQPELMAEGIPRPALRDCRVSKHSKKKAKGMFRILVGFLFLITSQNLASGADDNAMIIESEGRYHIQKKDSMDVAKAIARYEAKRAAVELAGRYLARKSLIETYDMEKEEIYSLATRKIRAEILEEKRVYVKKENLFWVRLRAWVRPSDFVSAEILDERIEQEARKEPFLKEMEPNISPQLDPGKEIAKGYRLLRKKMWRLTVIYLDRLETKYPGWDEIHMVKALAYYSLNDADQVQKSLQAACRLGNQKACLELKSLKKIHDTSFD